MSKKIMKRSLALGALMAFVITGSAWADGVTEDLSNGGKRYTGYADTSGHGGAPITDGSILTIKNYEFISNSVTGKSKKGGALNYSIGTFSIENSYFNGNSTTQDKGGAISVNGGTDTTKKSKLTLNGTDKDGNEFIGNIAYAWGGAINSEGNADITLNGKNVFKNNVVTDRSGTNGGGGAIGLEAVDNKSVADTLNIYGDITFENNVAKMGGAIYSASYNANINKRSVVTFKDVVAEFKNNIAVGVPGWNGTFYDNTRGVYGGAIYNSGEMNFDENTKANFNGNIAFGNKDNNGGLGGAIYNDSKGEINFKTGSAVSFVDNKANAKIELKGASITDGYIVKEYEANDIFNAGVINIYDEAEVNLDGGINGNGTTNIIGGTLNGKFTGTSSAANKVSLKDGGTWNLQGDSVVKGIEVNGDATINGDKEDGSRSVLSLNKDISDPNSFVIKHNAGELKVQNVTLENIEKTCDAEFCGVVLLNTADVEIANSSIVGNRYEKGSGIVFSAGKTISVINSEFKGNYAGIYAGALWHQSGVLNITNSNFEGNNAGNSGGAIYIDSATVNFDGNVTFSDNIANGLPNDIYNDGTINIYSNAYVTFNGGVDGDGTTNINGGTLELGGNNRIGTLNASGNAKIVFGEKGHLDVDVMCDEFNSLIITDANKTADNLNTPEDLTAVAEKMGVKAPNDANGKVKVVMAAGEIVGETTGDVVFETKVNEDGVDYYHGVVKNKIEQSNPANEAISDTAIGMKLHWRAHVNDMNKRMGELRDANGEHGVWTRMVRGESEYKNTKAQYNQYQLGYDEKLSVDKRWTVGAAVTFSEGDASYGYGSTEDKSTAFAIYGSKLNNDGTFVDLIARYAHLESDVDDQAGKGSYSANGMSVSAEFGKRIQQGNGLWIEPQAELTYGTIDSAEYKLGTKTVEVGDMDSLIGRIGFRIGKDIEKGNVYARASYLYDFEGETENAFRNDTARRSFNEDLGGGWWEVGVGANINLSKATYVYADIEKTFGGEVDTNWQWNLGVRYSF